MRDRFLDGRSEPEYKICPFCGHCGVLFTGLGFICAGGCSATVKEISEAGDDLVKLKKTLRKNRNQNLAFQRKNRSKKKRQRQNKN